MVFRLGQQFIHVRRVYLLNFRTYCSISAVENSVPSNTNPKVRFETLLTHTVSTMRRDIVIRRYV